MDDDGLDNDVLDHSESLEEFENYDSPENSFSPDILDELENLDKNDLDDQRPHHQSLRGESLRDRESPFRDHLDVFERQSESDNEVFEPPAPQDTANPRDQGIAESSQTENSSGFTDQQVRSTIQITLRRHPSTGFGFRPASGVCPEPIVASVIKGSSAARHGLKIGDRIRSVIIRNNSPGEPGPPIYHHITSVSQIKTILGQCQSFVTLCIFRDMEEIESEVELEPLTPLGLGLQTTNVGIFVTSVQPGSIGDVFGYRFGDQILSINGCPVHDSEDIRRIRRRSLREMEHKRQKKKSGLFRSVSSLSTQSRSENARERLSSSSANMRERIRVSVGRRNIDTLSEHPIIAIYNDTEPRSSPLNILEPVFDDATAPDPALLTDENFAPPITTSSLGQTASSELSNENETSAQINLPGSRMPILSEEDQLLQELRSLGPSNQNSPEKSKNLDLSREINEDQPSCSAAYPALDPIRNSDEPFLFKNSPIADIHPFPEGESLKTTAENHLPRKSTSEIDLKCVVCLDGAKEIVFQPCWHQVTCPECAVRLKECPLCRERIAIRRRPYRC